VCLISKNETCAAIDNVDAVPGVLVEKEVVVSFSPILANTPAN
jgi:hypothetical protein